MIPHPLLPHPSKENVPSLQSRIIGLLFVVIILVTAIFASVYILLPLSIVFSWNRSYLYSLFDTISSPFFSAVAGMLEQLGQIKLIVTVDKDQASNFTFEKDNLMIICNHRTEIDWFFHWNLAVRWNCGHAIKTMMKSSLKHVPGVGWTLRLLKFPFLQRDWNVDKHSIISRINEYKKSRKFTWLVLFPEGTALNPKTWKKSITFASKEGSLLYNYVLTPRTKGFELCVNTFQPSAIIDITIAYPDIKEGIRPSPIRFLNGCFPKEVHIHLRKYKSKDYVLEDKQKWIKTRFYEKEKLLKMFYSKGSFDGINFPLKNSFIEFIKSYIICGILLLFFLYFYIYFYYCKLWFWFSIVFFIIDGFLRKH